MASYYVGLMSVNLFRLFFFLLFSFLFFFCFVFCFFLFFFVFFLFLFFSSVLFFCFLFFSLWPLLVCYIKIINKYSRLELRDISIWAIVSITHTFYTII